MNDLFKTDDASMLMNTRGSIDADSIASTKWLKRMFRFEKGEPVLINKKALASISAEKFDKPSVKGAFAGEPKKIHQRLLKRTSDNAVVVPG